MKTSRMLFILILLISGLAMYSTVGAQQAKEQASISKLRVGTFDSRAVAIAYARSEKFVNYVQGLKAEHAKAKKEGNEKRVKELEAEGPALQELLHKQGFSTWPVDDILAQIKDRIPEIAKKAEVDVIVSKWNIVYQQPGIEFIDVTDLMVIPFNPDEETLKLLKSLHEVEPVSLEELSEHESD